MIDDTERKPPSRFCFQISLQEITRDRLKLEVFQITNEVKPHAVATGRSGGQFPFPLNNGKNASRIQSPTVQTREIGSPGMRIDRLEPFCQFDLSFRTSHVRAGPKDLAAPPLILPPESDPVPGQTVGLRL